jgi:hypothetical protein
VNENAWHDNSLYVMVKSRNPVAKLSDVLIDAIQVKRLRKPQFRTVLFDDFSNPEYPLYDIFSWQVADIWNEGLNNNDAFDITTNETARSQHGWRGIASSVFGVLALPEETIRVTFDYRLDLANGSNNTWNVGDFCLVPDDGVIFTNSYNNPPVNYDGYGTNGLSARIEFNAWKGPNGVEYPDGRIVLHQCGTTTYFDDPSVLGLSPITGDDKVSDSLQVTLAYAKSTTNNEWLAVAEIYNVDTGSNFVSSVQTVVHANAYTNELFLAVMNAGQIPTDGYYELDNVLVEIEAGPPPVGFEAFVYKYGLTGGKTDHGDSDGLNDWGEYVFGGHPTDSSDVGTQPWFDASSGDYIYSLLGDDTITAYVVTKDDLLNDPVWVHSATTAVTATDGLLGSYTNHVGTGDGSKFIQLLVD